MPYKPMTGPIPGENFTSDTKNYPWHRPPQHVDLDDAIEDAFKNLMSKNASSSALTLMDMGVSIATITDMYVTQGISQGKWTVDIALLMAGPIAHILFLLAKGYGIDPDLGVDNKITTPPKALFEEMKKINEAKRQAATVGIDLSRIQGAASDQEAPAEAPAPDESMPSVPAAAGAPMTGMMAGGK
jgi:hypothetical protein